MLALLLAATLSPQAHAAGYYFTDSGTRAMGRGGAFVAGADDLSAQYYNPAALIHLKGPQAYVNFSLFSQPVQFTRKDYDTDGNLTNTWDTIKNSAPPMYIPAIGVGHNFGLKNTYFALGMWTPMAPSFRYPSDGSNHYTLKDSLTWQIWAGPSVAQRIGWLTLGAGVHWTLVRAEESLDLMICQDEAPFDGKIGSCPSGATPEENDLHAELKMWDKGSLAANFGILAEPAPWISIGASALPPVKVHGKGSLGVQFAPDHWLLEGDGVGNSNLIANDSAKDDNVSVNLTMPWILRGGVAVRPVPKLEIEGDAVYQMWSMAKEIQVTDVSLTLQHNPDQSILTEDQTITDDIVLPQGYQDAISLRLGGDYDATDFLTVRAGGYYETSAIPTTTQSVTLVDGSKWGMAAGLTARIKGRLAIDAAFSQAFLQTRDIKNSDVRRIEVPVDLVAVGFNGEPLQIKNGEVVGNGLLKSSVTTGSLGLTFYWGKEAGKDAAADMALKGT